LFRKHVHARATETQAGEQAEPSDSATWLRIARQRLSATNPTDPSAEENWPAANCPWASAVATLREEVLALEKAVLAFPPERLYERAPASEPQTFYVLLHGVIQHSAYHAGQIALLKAAMLRNSAANR
jgi:hypothetical protein